MSIEKIDFSYLKQEKKTFTTNLNAVIQNVKNPIALGVWVYLTSLPEGWIVNKQHLQKHFDIGRDRLNSVLSYLDQNNLIEIGQERLLDGKMSKGFINVKCGYGFNVDVPMPDCSYPQVVSPHTEKPYTAEPYTVKQQLYNKQKAINKIKAEGSPLCSFFEPNEENKILCEDLRLNMNEELESFKNRHKGEKTQYEFSRWLKNSKQYIDNKKNTQNNEVKSTVKEWGPGHPDYDRLHGVKLKEVNKEDKFDGTNKQRNKTWGNDMLKVKDYIF